MRRIILVLSVAALMAVMIAGPAKADIIHNNGFHNGIHNDSGSDNTVFLSSNDSSFNTFSVDNNSSDFSDLVNFDGGDLVDFDNLFDDGLDLDNHFGDVRLGGNGSVTLVG